MKVALYPGSFNPWHIGHADILYKASQVFDKIIVCQMINLEKNYNSVILTKDTVETLLDKQNMKLSCDYEIESYPGLMVDAVYNLECNAVIRGLRNSKDFEYEANLMYWNQELGLKVPVVCFISEQDYTHISSSSIRVLENYKNRVTRTLF